MVFGCFGLNVMDKKITDIRPQKKNKNRVSIYLDGIYAFGLTGIVAAWLQIGQSLSDDKIVDLQNSDKSEVAYQKALYQLDYRLRTEKEVRQGLIKKGFEQFEIDGVLERLRNANLVQDERFAAMWVENRTQFHPRSRRLMRQELKIKGVSEEHIEKAIADSEEDVELATRTATRYARRLSGLNWLDFRKRLSAHLAYRGFSYGTVAPVVQSIWNSQELCSTENLENEEYKNGT
jgi:regulatory protein